MRKSAVIVSERPPPSPFTVEMYSNAVLVMSYLGVAVRPPVQGAVVLVGEVHLRPTSHDVLCGKIVVVELVQQRRGSWQVFPLKPEATFPVAGDLGLAFDAGAGRLVVVVDGIDVRSPLGWRSPSIPRS